jgi:GT2 family glycosyltransferase
LAPALSIIIPTYNRLPRLLQVLDAIAGQTFQRDAFEVIVVSDGSNDGTDDCLNRLRLPLNLTFASQDNRGPAAARNAGIALAKGDILLFIDDDVVPLPELVAEHMRIHRAAGKDLVVIGPMLTPPHHRLGAPVRWEQAMLLRQYEAFATNSSWPTYRQFYTGNASLPARMLKQVGSFDERFRRAEDIELAFRLAQTGSCTFVFNPRAIGLHYAERTFRSWMKNAYEYGRNDVVFARERGQKGPLFDLRYEFAERHGVIQWLSRTCSGRKRASLLVEWSARAASSAADLVRLEHVERAALSGAYSISYYNGVAHALGGRSAFIEAFGPLPSDPCAGTNDAAANELILPQHSTSSSDGASK